MKINCLKSGLITLCVLVVSVSHGQTKGFIYQQATNATARTVLDPNGDGFTSLTNAGFSGTDDILTNSELQTVTLPVLFGETFGDLSTGASGGHTDLVSNTASGTHSVSVMVKTVNGIQYLVVRFRIGRSSTASKGYSLLIDSDNSFGTYLTSNNPGYDREIIMETGNPGNIKIYKHSTSGDGGVGQVLATYNAEEYSQRSIAATTNNGDEDYFYDFCVPLSAIQATNAVRITAATITSAQSGITGTVSDFNGVGVYANPFQAMKDIINTFPSGVKFTDIIPGFSFSLPLTVAPTVTSGISAGSTSVSGTSTEANTTGIRVYRRRSGTDESIGTTTVTSNQWTLSALGASVLQSGDIVWAKAKASGRDSSSASNEVYVSAAACYTPPPAIHERRNGQLELNISWTEPNGLTYGATAVQIRVYNSVTNTEVIQTGGAAQYINPATGTLTFLCNGTFANQSAFAPVSFYATATYNNCTSRIGNVMTGTGLVLTPAPIMVTTSIEASNTIARTVQVTSNSGAGSTSTLYLYMNSALVASQTGIAHGSTHSFQYTGFLKDAIVSARALRTDNSTYLLSNRSDSLKVSAASALTSSTPTITGSYTSGSGKTVSGYSDEAPGTTIYLYSNGTLIGTGTVNAFGSWSITGLTLTNTHTLTAKALAPDKLVSNASAGVPVLDGSASIPVTPTITTTPIVVGSTTIISGTAGAGRVILYLNDEAFDSSATNSVSGAWSITLADKSLLTKGSMVSAKNWSPTTGLFSNESAEVQVTGVTSFLITNTSGGNIATQTAGVSFDIKLNAVDGVNATITSYTGTNNILGTYAITSGSSTSNFSSGVLNTHSLTLTKAGTYTLRTLSESDPTVIGTSNSFTVSPADANKLLVNTAPSNQNNTNSSFGTQPIIHITDTYDNTRLADNAGSVTVSIKSGTTGAVLSGTSLAVSVVNGVADFSSQALKIDRPGEYVLTFTSSTGLTAVDSDPIYVGRVWKGSNSTDFNTNNNWSNSTIPNANDDIAFAQSPTSDLYLDGDRTITNYYNYSTNSKKLIVNGKKLTVKGTINHGGSSIDASASSSDVEFAGTAAQTIAANTFVSNRAYKITINNSNGVALAGSLRITGELKPQDGVFATNNHLTIGSSSIANTAIVSQGSASGGYITGSVTVERYIPPRRAYRIITSPVTTTGTIRDNWQEGVNNTAAGYSNNQNPNPGYGTHITGPQGSAAGFDMTQSTNASLFSYNNATQSWSAITNTNATTLQVGVAYRLMIRGDRSIDYSTNTPTPTFTVLRMTGTLAQGDQNAVSLSSTSDAWNIIANPYQSQVDITAITRNNIRDRYYIWDAQMGMRGAWVSYDFVSGKSVSETEINKLVQPGQAFFMQTTANGSASVTFNESDKNNTTAFTQVYKENSVITKLYASLYYSDSLATNARPADGFSVAFDASFNNSNADDLHKLANLDENFSLERGNKLLSVEKRQHPALNDSIHIHINQYRDQNYTMRLKWENPVLLNTNAFLVDRYTNTEHLLSTSGVTDVNYTINSNITASVDARRFVIVFKNSNPLPVTGIEVNAKTIADDVAVRWKALNEFAISHYDVQKRSDATDFKSVFKTSATNNDYSSPTYNWLDQYPAAGNNYYRVVAVGNDGRQQISPVVKVYFANGLNSAIVIAPNPVLNRHVKFEVRDLKAGVYLVNVIDAVGKVIAVKQLVHDGAKTHYSLLLPFNPAPGVYHLVVKGEQFLRTSSFRLN